MKKKVVLAFVLVFASAMLTGCASEASMASVSDKALAEEIGEEKQNENQEIIDDLKQVKEIIKREHDSLDDTIFAAGDNHSSIDAFNALLTQYEEDARTLKEVARTGNDSIDKTYDAAIYYNSEITEITKNYRDTVKVRTDIVDASKPLKDYDSSKESTDSKVVESLYKAMSNFYDAVNKAEYPSYCQSRMNIFKRKIQYYETGLYEAHLAVSNDDPLRYYAAYNVIVRAGKEYTESRDQLLSSFEVQEKAEKAAYDELNIVYSELMDNTDIILGVLEGGE